MGHVIELLNVEVPETHGDSKTIQKKQGWIQMVAMMVLY
jgi:hypothetical protein